MISNGILKDFTNKAFMEEGVRNAFILESQLLKRRNVFFHYTKLFKFGKITQMMCVYVKAFIKVCKKLGPRNIPSM